jgi:hypothetical protein
MIGTRAISCECGAWTLRILTAVLASRSHLLFCPLSSVPNFVLVFYADSRPVDCGDSRYPDVLEDRWGLIYIVKHNLE